MFSRVEAMKQEIAQLKVEHRLSDMQWTGKEQNYKKTIQQLQSKVTKFTTTTVTLIDWE